MRSLLALGKKRKASFEPSWSLAMPLLSKYTLTPTTSKSCSLLPRFRNPHSLFYHPIGSSNRIAMARGKGSLRFIKPHQTSTIQATNQVKLVRSPLQVRHRPEYQATMPTPPDDSFRWHIPGSHCSRSLALVDGGRFRQALD